MARRSNTKRRNGGSDGLIRSTVRKFTYAVGGLCIVGAGMYLLVTGPLDDGVKEIRLPLRHDDIIRQQARDKQLDPALIAAVIYRESHFRPRPSRAGAQGLMQILPETAHYIARKSGGTEFVTGDLATPQINISYGSWYLAYLLRQYHGNEVTALAAYNAGEGKVAEWLHEQGVQELTSPAQIPFPETRHYVAGVLDARREYRREYRAELTV